MKAQLTFAVLFAVVGYGFGLRCYQCNSQNDPKCGDPFTTTNSVDCDATTSLQYNSEIFSFYSANIFPTSAKKVCAKINLQNKNVVRTCLPSLGGNTNVVCDVFKNAASTAAATGIPQVMVGECSVCEKDNCNAAGSNVASPLAILAVLAALYYKL